MQQAVAEPLAPAIVPPAVTAAPARAEGTVFAVLLAISFSHMLNDMMQSLLPAIYPMLKRNFGLDFAAVGLLTLTFQMTASVLQPLVGLFTDRKPLPYSLPMAMAFTMVGLVMLAHAPNYTMLLAAAAMVGVGSSIFHPESSRVARMASGGRFGMAQSLFQVGGNFGQSLGPLLAAFIILPRGQGSIAWFTIATLVGMGVLLAVGRWYSTHRYLLKPKRRAAGATVALSRRRIGGALTILLVLIFSKYFYLSSLTSYYTFYLIHTFGVSVRDSQTHLFIFLAAVAAGTFLGGPIGDRIGRKYVIWGSILGVLPFTLMLPHANLFWTTILTVVIGLVIASAFSAILVYATELVPGKVGTIGGLFFGLAFGMGGLGAAVLGVLADYTSIGFVYQVCAFLPAIGLLTGFLPNIERAHG